MSRSSAGASQDQLPNLSSPEFPSRGKEYGGDQWSSDRMQERDHEDESVGETSLLLPKERVKPLASTLSSIFNLTNTTVGAGVLTIPYALSKTGVLLGVALIMAVCLVAGLSHLLLIDLADKTKCTTYRELAIYTFGPRAGRFVDFVIIFYTIGTLIAYPIIIGGNLPDVIQEITEAWFSGEWPFSENEGRALLMSLTMFIVIVPTSMLPNLDALKHTSMMAITCIAYLMVVILYTYAAGTQESKDNDVVYVSGDFDLFLAFPLISVSFTAHYNVLRIYHEYENRSRERMKRVIVASLAIISCLYLLIGVPGYLAFRADVEDDILTNLDEDKPWNVVAKFGLVLTIVFSYPLVVFATRSSLHSFLFPTKASTIDRLRVLTLVLATISLVVAIFVPDVSVVFSFTGSSFGVMIVYILPAAMTLHLSRLPYTHPSNRRAFCILVAGIVFGLLAFSVAIYNVAS
eukprot:TRINITY_DN2319_c0_g2_i1.p1 TRINITY_DN2319_c0_g2~~TRINITY_DN2319_c0_g2_i1.p1  ORF type:complete len:461 (-),score=102.55 TRINITY_DN2319_c0_g2_i1:4-1386(-)